MNLKEELKKCLDVKGNFSGAKFKSSGLLELVKTETQFLNDYEVSNRERVHCILNDITEVIFCPSTGIKLKYSAFKKNYVDNIQHSRKNHKRIKKFDYETRNRNTWIKILDTYKSKDFILLTVEECLNCYQTLTVKKSSVISLMKAFIEIDLTCSIFKHTQFMMVDSLNLAERIYCLENKINTVQLDYRGVPLKFRDRTSGYSVYGDSKTMYEHKLENMKEILSEKYILNDFIRNFSDKGTDMSRLSLTCKVCDYNFLSLFTNALWKDAECPRCEGYSDISSGRSKMELQLVKFLKDNGIVNIIENDRQVLNGYELDVYLPDYNIAVELCGLTWHSFGTSFPNNADIEKSKKHRHLEKYKKCKDLGIKLITVFEHEWKYRQDLVKSIIINKLNKSPDRIFARKCKFSEVSKRDANEFLDINHIQKHCSYSQSYGLYYNNELVSLMCFGKRKLTRGDMEYELIRFCNKMNTSVVGGASKILKNSKVDNFISYCDLRYSDGNLYEALGMKLLRTTTPNYYYSKHLTLYHRMNFQKHKISDKGDTRTEKEIMYSNGYRRIYDCGNLVFGYTRD